MNWNRHLIPLYSQKCEPFQVVKTKLLTLEPPSGQGRKAHGARTKIADYVDISDHSPFCQAFTSLKEELCGKPALYHFKNDRELDVFVDALKEMGMGVAAYQ